MEYLWQKWQNPQNLTYLLFSSIPNKKQDTNILYKVCPSFCSHCSNKWPQQKQASGRRIYFSSQFKIKVHHKRKSWLSKFESWPQQIHQERAVHRPVNLHFTSLWLPLQILLAYVKPRIKIKHDKVSEISSPSTRICKMAQAIFTFIQKTLVGYHILASYWIFPFHV